LIGHDGLRPLSEAVLHEGLRVLVAVVREDHVGLSVARRSVGILPSRKLDLIPCLLLEVREEVVLEATILRRHH
jgi:hypothetical protein